MARNNRLANMLLFVMLEAGALMGVPMRPEEIEAMARSMNGGSVASVEQAEEEDED